MKILKRTSNVFNLILFQVFSFLFLHVVFSLTTGHSALNMESLSNFALNYIFLISLLSINIISIFLVKKISYYQVLFTSVIVSIICSIQFFESFDKMILFYNLFYIFISFFFIMIWKLELEESVYNPKYDSRELRASGLQKVTVSLSDSGGGQVFGTIQNWSKRSFFISTKEFDLNLNDQISVEITYQSISFQFKAKIATLSNDGFGLYVLREQKSTRLNWVDFYDIICDRGIYPITV